MYVCVEMGGCSGLGCGGGVLWAFAENIIVMAPVTLSIRLCRASLCVSTGRAPEMFH